MSLKKLDGIIRQNSTTSIDDAIQIFKDWVNNRQNSDKNKDENGKYIYDFYCEVIDSRTKELYLVFSDVSTDKYHIGDTYIKNNGDEVKGVITLLTRETIKKNLIKTKIVEMNSNPYIIEEDFESVIYETDNLVAELRLKGNAIYAYDSRGFTEEKQMLDIEKEKVKLYITIIKK